MTILRKLAASIGATLVALGPLLFASPAYADALSEAQAALAAGRQEVVDATQHKLTTDQAVAAALVALQATQNDVSVAQSDYDTNLIPEPDWTAPTQTVQHTRVVETVTRVAHTTTEVIGGITAKVYNRQGYNEAPPLPAVGETPVLTTTVSQINFDWGGNQVLDSGYYEDVLVEFTGTLVVPTTGVYQFYAPGDDGIKVYLDGNLIINDWYDKGGGGTVSGGIQLTAGQAVSLTLYFYENGGGANVWFYYAMGGSDFTLVPANWVGSQTVETVTYTDEVTYTTEVFFTEEPVEGATAPLVHDPVLLEILNNKVASAIQAESDHGDAVSAQTAAVSRLAVAEAAIPVLEKAVVDATPVEPVDPEPPVVPEPPVTPPVTPEPPVSPTAVEQPVVTPEPVEPVTPKPPKEPDVTTLSANEIDPTTLDAAEVEALQEVAYETLATADPESEEYQEALDLLFVAAQADDIVVDEALAAIPLLGNAAVALVDAVNFMGNVGSDMSPKVREESKKIVISAVVAVGAAVNAATGAAVAASSSPSTRKVS